MDMERATRDKMMAEQMRDKMMAEQAQFGQAACNEAPKRQALMQSLRERVAKQLSLAKQQGMRAIWLEELAYLLDKNTAVGRIIELLDLTRE